MRHAVIIADASVVVEVLLGSGETGAAIRHRLAATDVHCPHLVDLEVTAALRRLVAMERVGAHEARLALDVLSSMDITRHSHKQYLPRIWELRDSVTAYDAAYVALAERAGAPLLTVDRRLAEAHGPRCQIEVLEI